MPTPVPHKGWEIVGAYLALIFLGIPALLLLILIHLGVVDLICNCVPFGLFTDLTPGSRIFAAGVTAIPVGLADWFVWTRWRSYRRESKWANAYREKHLPDYARRKGYK